MGRPGPEGPKRAPSEFELLVAKVVRAIPAGQVSSYSQIAARAGRPKGARMVSRALGAVAGLPWWRVIQAGGTLAPAVAAEQARLLRKEGVTVVGRRVVTDDGDSGAVPVPPSRGGRRAAVPIRGKPVGHQGRPRNLR